jgi:hypothetical protein
MKPKGYRKDEILVMTLEGTLAAMALLSLVLLRARK